MVILLSRSFGRKDASTFPNKWILIIHQVITSGSIMNWGEIISSNINSQLKKVQSKHKFYMASCLLDVMCANREYPYLGWKWNLSLSSIHIYFEMLWETSITKTMKEYVMAYLHQSIIFFLERKIYVYPLKDRQLCRSMVTSI